MVVGEAVTPQVQPTVGRGPDPEQADARPHYLAPFRHTRMGLACLWECCHEARSATLEIDRCCMFPLWRVGGWVGGGVPNPTGLFAEQREAVMPVEAVKAPRIRSEAEMAAAEAIVLRTVSLRSSLCVETCVACPTVNIWS